MKEEKGNCPMFRLFDPPVTSTLPDVLFTTLDPTLSLQRAEATFNVFDRDDGKAMSKKDFDVAQAYMATVSKNYAKWMCKAEEILEMADEANKSGN